MPNDFSSIDNDSGLLKSFYSPGSQAVKSKKRTPLEQALKDKREKLSISKLGTNMDDEGGELNGEDS